MRRKVQLKIFKKKIFKSKLLWGVPKHRWKGWTAHKLRKLDALGARTLTKCLWVSSFQFSEPEAPPRHIRAFKSAQMRLRRIYWTGVCVQQNCVPAFPVRLTGPRGSPSRLTGPTRGPLFELVWFSEIIKGRPKFRTRTSPAVRVEMLNRGPGTTIQRWKLETYERWGFVRWHLSVSDMSHNNLRFG